MRIPTSVIVMSLLTAAPFGLAIRDTLDKKDRVSDDDEYDFDGSRARRKSMEEYEREAEREATERARKSEERLSKLDTLYGHTPASMGSLLDGIVLGADAASFQPEAARSRITSATRDGFMNVSFDVDAKSLNGVTIEISGGYDYDSSASQSTCDTLRDRLGAAWGPTSGSTWVDATTHQRATLDPVACSLTFERYFDTPAWVAALPIDAVGKSAEKFVATLGPTVESDEMGATWRVAGLGLGSGQTRFEAYFEHGKVVAIQARVTSDFDTGVQVREELAARLKAQPKRNLDTGTWDWKRRVPVSVEHPMGVDQSSGQVLTVLVGTIPWE